MGAPRGSPRAWFGLAAAHLARSEHPVLRNFFADRCPHLAAMIAYYALLSAVPLLFLLFSVVSVFGGSQSDSFLVDQLKLALPGQSVQDLIDLVESLRRRATELGVFGGFALLWTSLGLLSAIESALNIVYEVPNRSFVRQKVFVFTLVGGFIASSFIVLVGATTTYAWLRELRPGVFGSRPAGLAISIIFGSLATCAILYTLYRYLPNTTVTARDAWPGAIVATVALQVVTHGLPLYLRATANVPALQAFSGVLVLLVWLYTLGNILLFGAEINWWFARERGGHDAPTPPVS